MLNCLKILLSDLLLTGHLPSDLTPQCETLSIYVFHIGILIFGSQSQDIRNICDIVCTCRLALEIRVLIGSKCHYSDLNDLGSFLKELQLKYSYSAAETKLKHPIEASNSIEVDDDFSDWDEDSDTLNCSAIVDDSCNNTRSFDSYLSILFDEIAVANRLIS